MARIISFAAKTNEQ
jgi:hypothetical protein